jgi:3-isopropylmalate/(R)-2-methylmalate dehydratase small subunit
MQSIITGKAYVLGDNIDTDQIIPAQYLTFNPSIPEEYKQFGKYALSSVPPSQSGLPKGHVPFHTDDEFVSPYKIVIGGKNFGCGSSREHAPWALDQYGFRAIIAPSYADIFFNNCFKNGLLPIVLPEAQVAQLFDEAAAFPGYQLTIDLERQVIVKPQGGELPFEVQPFRKFCLVNGFDDIGLTLRQSDKIKNFEAERLAKKPWLAHTL